MVRCAGARARPPPSPRRMRGRPTTPHDRRAACPLARGLRARMDRLSDRPPALHRRRQVLDLVLARPQPSLPPLRANGSLTPSRRSAPPDSSLASTQVGPTTAVTAGPVQVDIATKPSAVAPSPTSQNSRPRSAPTSTATTNAPRRSAGPRPPRSYSAKSNVNQSTTRDTSPSFIPT